MKNKLIYVLCFISYIFIMITLFRVAFGVNKHISIYGLIELFNNFDLRVPFKNIIDNFSTIGNGFTWDIGSTFFSNILDAINYGFQFMFVPLNIITSVFRFIWYLLSYVINSIVYILGFNPFIT